MPTAPFPASVAAAANGASAPAMASAAAMAPARRASASPDELSLSVIMPTISWTGCFEACARQVIRLIEEIPSRKAEFLVVFDGSGTAPPAWLSAAGVRVVFTGSKRGPATARNLAASIAVGRVLLFVDADCELAPDAIGRVEATFAAAPDLVGMFGAYDDAPACSGMVSQFRNLLHHHTHITHAGRAGTFWAGCGAIRRGAFDDIGGFDEGFRHPCIEDIELGMRVRANGGRIRLDPDLRCKHHKSWTLISMIKTDVLHRAVPWTHLILKQGEIPTTLNLDWSNRICGAAAVLALVVGALGIAVGGTPMRAAFILALLLQGTLAWMHLDFYWLCFRRGGAIFGLTAFALHWLFYVYSTLTFGTVVALSKAKTFARCGKSYP
ncbi:MAG: hypothetical protein RLZZ326_4091 [Planctomycetota bacterium]